MKIKYFTGLAVAALTFVGCSEEFLETEPTEFVSSSQLAEYSVDNPGLQAGNISGIYSLMYEVATGGSDPLSPSHDDFGQKGYDIFTDMLSSDMVLGGLTYGWYSNIARMQPTVDNTNIRNYYPWRYYYRIIFSANNVIGSLGGNDAVPENEEGQIYMGQAKAMRAYAYFYLAQLYAEEYNPSTPILPVYTDTQTDAQPLSPTSDVYALIVSDLRDAIELLDGWNRSGKQQVNKYVAEGLLAYAYAAMGDYNSVLPLTADIINNGGFPITTAEQAVGGFNTVTTPSWMWGMDLTENQGLDLISWWGQMDIFTYSYAYVGDPKAIDLGLYNAIPEGDVRKGQFQVHPNYGANQPLPINKFYPDARTLGGQRYISTDYIYMRVDEFYLLHAEAAAKTGQEDIAKEYLKMLLEERVDNPSYVDALSGNALVNEIYLQTRIELWGEGKSYLAMKRNQATVTRGSNHLVNPGESYSYNDDRLTFEIPLSEIQNNPNIN